MTDILFQPDVNMDFSYSNYFYIFISILSYRIGYLIMYAHFLSLKANLIT